MALIGGFACPLATAVLVFWSCIIAGVCTCARAGVAEAMGRDCDYVNDFSYSATMARARRPWFQWPVSEKVVSPAVNLARDESCAVH